MVVKSMEGVVGALLCALYFECSVVLYFLTAGGAPSNGQAHPSTKHQAQRTETTLQLVYFPR
jgi:hypothetical protein